MPEVMPTPLTHAQAKPGFNGNGVEQQIEAGNHHHDSNKKLPLSSLTTTRTTHALHL